MNTIVFRLDYLFLMLIASRALKNFLLFFLKWFCIIIENFSHYNGYESISVITTFYGYKLFDVIIMWVTSWCNG